MKKFILLSIIFILLISCDNKDTPPIQKGKPDPNALIVIKPAKQTKTMTTGLSNRDIVELADAIHYTSHYSNNKYEKDSRTFGRAFNDDMKDIDKLELKMLGIDVISAEGDYYRDLTYAYDVYLVTYDNDTIGYVPDALIEEARIKIEAAFKDSDFDTIYDLFNTAFKFLPIEE